MFTGIVEEIGNIKNIERGSKSIKLTVNCSKIISDIKLGDSIAVNGICLTVTGFSNTYFSADVMPETMNKTNLGNLQVLSQVNLERAVKLSDRLGGHIVSGHIDGTGVVVDRSIDENAVWLSIKAENSILKYIIMKGSVALDGTSLTVAYADDMIFKVSLIPLTAKMTVLGKKNPGDVINIECDVLGKYIEKLILGNRDNGVKQKEGISINFLKENGFI